MPWLFCLYHIIIWPIAYRFWYSAFIKLNLSIVLDDILKECRKWLFQSSSINFRILITVDFKPEQIRIVYFVTMTSDRNDSVKILDSFLPDISASILKSYYAKLLARSRYTHSRWYYG